MLRRFTNKNNNHNIVRSSPATFVRYCSSTTSTSTETDNNKSSILDQQQQQTSNTDSSSKKLTATEQLRQEKEEHDNFMHWVRNHQKVMTLHCAPKRMCSATRIIKDREADPRAVQRHQGRGLIATKDVFTGNVLAAAPILEVGVFTDKIRQRAMKLPESEHENPFRESYRTMPSFDICCKAAQESAGFQDWFVPSQGNLALCVALERCHPSPAHSPLGPYLDTLPVPAVDDKNILELYKDFLGEDKAIYLGHYKDHHDFIVQLHKEWTLNANNDNNIFVPPVQVIDWAWRIVLSRQLPLPVYAKPMMSLEDQRHFGVGYHYMNWVSINEGNPDATLYPTLIPFFDLLDHGPVANVRLDIVTRKVTYGFGTGGEQAKLENDAMHNAPAARSGESMMEKIKRKAMSYAGMNVVSGSSNEALVAYLELQALTDIDAGEELTIKYNVEESERAFTLYRHGFLPVTH